MESKVFSYGKTYINKIAFHEETNSINNDEVEIDKIMLFDKTSYGNESSLYMYKGEAFPSSLCIKLPQLI